MKLIHISKLYEMVVSDFGIMDGWNAYKKYCPYHVVLDCVTKKHVLSFSSAVE